MKRKFFAFKADPFPVKEEGGGVEVGRWVVVEGVGSLTELLPLKVYPLPFRGMATPSGDVNLSNVFCFPSQKGSTLED